MAVSADLRHRILTEGVEALSNAELIALVADVAPQVAIEILGEVRSIQGLSGKRPRELAELPRVTERNAFRLLSAVELGRRSFTPPADMVQVKGGAQVAELCPDLAVRSDEVIAVLALNTSNQMTHRWIAARGWESGAGISPRALFSQVLKEGAAAIILVHNHPGGSLAPSVSDLAFTRRMAKAAKVLGVRLLDHVIVARSGFLSLRDHSKLEGVFDE